MTHPIVNRMEKEPGLLIVDLQSGFSPSQKLVENIRQAANDYRHIVMTQFVNKFEPGGPGNLYRTVLNWYEDGGSLVWTPPQAIILEKNGYGLTAQHIESIKRLQCTEWHICGLETDACILACAFSMWDNGIRPVVLEDLCDSPFHEVSVHLIRRQFGSGRP